jgi:hypothetical protein
MRMLGSHATDAPPHATSNEATAHWHAQRLGRGVPSRLAENLSCRVKPRVPSLSFPSHSFLSPPSSSSLSRTHTSAREQEEQAGLKEARSESLIMTPTCERLHGACLPSPLAS